MTKLFNKYNKMLKENKYLTETEIINLKSRISTNPCSLTSKEVVNLKDRLEYNQGDSVSYMITPEHAEKGIEYLRQKAFKLNGNRRNTKQVENMPWQFFEAIKKYDHFTFVGFEEVDYNIYSGRSFYMPVWRIHTTDGQFFDYYMGIKLEFNYTGEYNIKTHLKVLA